MRGAAHSLWWALRSTVLLAGLLSSACTGGQTGGEDATPPSFPFPGGAAMRTCQEETTPTVLASVDERSPAGFSAASVLRYADGTFTEPLDFERVPSHWYESTPDKPLSIEPGGDEPLDIEIKYADGELRHFAPRFDTLGVEPCRGRLEIDIHVTLRTPSGAFDESVEGVLMASSASEARLWLRFHTAAVEPARPPAAHSELPPVVVPVHRLAGDLSVTAVNDDGRHQIAFIELWLTLSELGVNGYLDAWLYRADKGSLRMARELATIGETCVGGYGYPIGPDQPPVPDGMAPTVREVLAALGAMQIDAVRDDGSRSGLSLDLEYTVDSACGSPGDVTPLFFQAVFSVAANLGDGAIDGRWPVELHVRSASDGSLASIYMTLVQPGDVSIERSEFESLETDWGVTGLELERYDEVLITFDLNVQPGTDPPGVTGELFIRGYVFPEDMSRPVAIKDGDVLGHLSFEAGP